MPAIRPDVLAASRPTAPRWKRVPGRGDYLLWDGSRYTTVARWNGSSWTLTELRPQPTPNQAFPGDLGYHASWILEWIVKAVF